MKKTLFLTLIIFCFNSTYAQNKIQWNHDIPLSWNDFKGDPDESIFAYALTATKIEVEPEEVIVNEKNEILNYQDLTVTAYFYCEESWVLHKDEHLLKHERNHFNIAEIYATKIRAEFKKLQEKGIANFDQYLSIYNSIYRESRMYQALYDSQTNHGQDVKENDLWDQKINQILKK